VEAAPALEVMLITCARGDSSLRSAWRAGAIEKKLTLKTDAGVLGGLQASHATCRPRPWAIPRVVDQPSR